jgi:hypothetical protein
VLPLVVTTVVVLVAFTPASTFACVPGSPDPVSPEVRCHGVGPSSNVVLTGEATRLMVPEGTQMVEELVLPGLPAATDWPLAERVHQVR